MLHKGGSEGRDGCGWHDSGMDDDDDVVAGKM